jgi:O-antigen/teichoic acid export membrane protein
MDSTINNSLSLKGRVLSAGYWGLLGTFSISAIRLLSSVFVARLLLPQDFAIAALAVVIMETVSRSTDFGVSAAIVREKEDSEQLTQTLFWTWIILIMITCTLVISGSQIISEFYEEKRLPRILVVMSFGMLAGGLNTVPLALLEKQIRLKEINLIRMATTFCVSLFAIFLAIASTGYWALILPSVVGSILQFPILLKLSGFQPRFFWGWHHFRRFLSFGFGVFLSRLCVFLSDNADYFVLGKYLPKPIFGQYYFAYSRSRLPYSAIAPALQAPLLAAFSKIREDPFRLREALLKVARVHFSVLAPIGLWLALLADPLIVVVFGQQWKQSIPIIQVYSLFFLFVAAGGFSGAPLLSMGKSWLLATIQLFRLLSILGALIWGVWTNQSILTISIGIVFMNLPAYILGMSYLFLKVGMRISEVWQGYRGCCLSLITSGFIFAFIRFCGWHPTEVGDTIYLLGSLTTLFIGYCAGTWLFNGDFADEILEFLKNKLNPKGAPSP